MTTDACLLGALANFETEGKALDIGTGTGVVAMFMAQKYPNTLIDAIEIEAAVIEQASFNIQNSPFKDRIQLIQADFLQHQFSQQYACIVSNPPYFKDHLEKEASEKNNAIHASLLNHQAMLDKVTEILHPDGCFYCILPPYQMTELIDKARVKGLQAERIIRIFNKPDKHYRDIVCFNFSSREMQEQLILLHDESGKKTDEFHRLMSDFYLEDTSIYKKNKQ